VSTALVLGGTAAIAAAVDPVEGRYFRKHGSTFDPFNDALSEHRTTSATLIAPAGLYIAGLIKRDSYLAKTGILAAEAWVDVDILGEVMRNAVRRKRPLDIPPDGNFSATWFKAKGSPMQTAGSFPSGHTAWGFAVATVIARRYPQHKWVAIVAYSLAAIDGISRITSSNHFASDTIFGGVLGYTVGRFVVVRR
jgi:membrane-associated phospholipid phosphatase